MPDDIIPATHAEVVTPKRPRGRPRKVAIPGAIANAVAPKPVAVAKKAATRLPMIDVPILPAPSSRPSSVTPLNYLFTIGRRKRAVCRLFLYKDGKGEIEVNGRALEAYFPSVVLQEIVRAPLAHSAFKDSLRIVGKVFGGGISGQAEAMRLGITRGLLKLDETLRPIFRARGFLTRDPREKERKKPGLKKARKGPQWAKR